LESAFFAARARHSSFVQSQEGYDYFFQGRVCSQQSRPEHFVSIQQSQWLFLEVGGNDGFSQSNTKRLELFLGWLGTLVEPYLPNFRRIAKTRTSRPLPVHAACVPFGFLELNVSLIHSDLMTSSLGMESDIFDPKNHSEVGARWIRSGKRVSEFESPAETLNSILKTADAPS
jgi:hypothetical protein